jgi:hypothetical protein
MNECSKERVLEILEAIGNGASAVNHPFIETFVKDESVRKAATTMYVLNLCAEGEKIFLPSRLLPPLD